MIELIAGSLDTGAMAQIRNAVMRWILTEPQTIEHFRGTMPGYRDWLAVLDGDPIGVAVCARIAGMEESAAAFAVNCVLPEAREQGVGTAIYRQVSAHARSLGKSELELFGFADDLGGLRFAERHGFVVANRARGLRLVLDGCPRPPLDLPENVAITNLAERPELARGVWELLCEAMPDMPYDGDVPMSSGSFEEFAARRLAGPDTSPRRRLPLSAKARSLGSDSSAGWTMRPASPSTKCLPCVAPGEGEGSARPSRQPRSSGRSTMVSASCVRETRSATHPRERSTRTSPTRRSPTGSSIEAHSQRQHSHLLRDSRDIPARWPKQGLPILARSTRSVAGSRAEKLQSANARPVAPRYLLTKIVDGQIAEVFFFEQRGCCRREEDLAAFCCIA